MNKTEPIQNNGFITSYKALLNLQYHDRMEFALQQRRALAPTIPLSQHYKAFIPLVKLNRSKQIIRYLSDNSLA